MNTGKNYNNYNFNLIDLKERLKGYEFCDLISLLAIMISSKEAIEEEIKRRTNAQNKDQS